MAGNTAASDRLGILLTDGLGLAARAVPERDRNLALDQLDPDERIEAVAIGRIRERSLVSGQLFVATGRRLIVVEAHRWKSSWHRSVPWRALGPLDTVGGAVVIDTGAEQFTVTSMLPENAADRFEQLRAQAADPAGPTDPSPADLGSHVEPVLADARHQVREAGSLVETETPEPAEPVEVPDGIRRSEVDGVPVFWVDRAPSDRLRAQLIVGVGAADESFLQGQLTHLLEHVVMRRFADVTYEVNAGVGIWITGFDVASRPQTVSRHLREICTAMTDLASGQVDSAIVEAERAVLTAEAAQDDGPPLALTLPAAAWFGRQGLGAVGESTLGLEYAGAADLADWCRARFTGASVAVALDGPPPDDLALPLPAGPRPARSVLPPRVLNTPAWTPGPPGFQVSFRTTRSLTTEVLMEALSVRWTRLLRHDGGLVYDLATTVVGLPGSEIVVSLSADATVEQSARIAVLLRADLRRLLDGGFTEAEVTAARERLDEQTGDPDWSMGLAVDLAVQAAGGPVATPVARPGSTEGVTRAEVDAAWRQSWPTVIIATDDESPDLPPLTWDDTPPVAGRTWPRARRGSFMEDGSAAVSGPAGVSVRWGPAEHDDWRTVRYDQVVALGTVQLAAQDVVLMLYSSTGSLVAVRARDWRDGEQLLPEIRASVPPHLHVVLPERMRPFDLGER